MADASSKIPHLLERLSQGVAAHDRENPEHHTWGIGMAFFDIERLGLEEGEAILPGIVLQADGGVTGAFRVLCDGDHDAGLEKEAEENVDAVADTESADEEERELQPVHPGGPSWPGRERERDDDPGPRPIRPPF